MAIFMVKTFARFARKERLAEAALVDAIARAERGLIDADLGGGVIKQRVARAGAGRSGGYRTIIAFRAGDCAIFLFGFAKNDRDNLDDGELAALRLIGAQWLGDHANILKDVEAGILIEVNDDQRT